MTNKISRNNPHSVNRGRRKFVAGTLAAGAAVATSGLPWINVARAQLNTIRIGHIDSFTGIRGAFGSASPWVLEKINALVKGGIEIGGKNYSVEILSRDSQSDPNRASTLGNELIFRENVDLMLLGDGLAAGVNEMADANGTPLIQTMIQHEPFYQARGSSPDKGYPWSFLFFWSGSEVVQNFFGLWNSIETNKTVGSFFVNNEFGQAFSAGLSGAIPKMGFKQVEGGLFKTETDDFTNQVAAFKNGSAEIVTGLAFPPHFVTFWSQAAQSGYLPKICTVAAAFLFPEGVNALGDRGDGMSTEIWWNKNWPYKSSLTGQSAEKLATEWEEASGKQWTQPLGYNHALWEVGLQVLKSSNDPKNREAVRDAIHNLDMETVIGRVNFKDSKLKNVAATSVVGGQWRKAKSGKFPYELLVTYNEIAPDIPIETDFVSLTDIYN